ncbi:hypothetical protein XF35_15100 [Streptomyces platensis subsp. clarensis]|nr:hypothetical protein [Streptomyces platensis subsp. clarensis]
MPSPHAATRSPPAWTPPIPRLHRPFVRHHINIINMLGRYSFQHPELPGGLRPLRDPGVSENE